MIITINLEDTDDKILVKAGDSVDFDVPLIKNQGRTPVTIHVAQELRISPKNIFQSLQKVVGDTVKKNDVLAAKKSLMGTKVLESPYDGIVKEINHEDGTVILDIEEEDKTTELSFFKGEVSEIKDDAISIKVKSSKNYPLQTATALFGGAILVPKVKDLTYLTEEELQGKVVLVDELKPHEQVKIDALGAAGTVASFDPKISMNGKMALLKKGLSISDVKTSDYKYCIIDKKSSTLYLYSL